MNSCSQAVTSVSQWKEFWKAFIISPPPSMILEVTPNVYFFTMLLHQIIAGLSHLHLNGTWMYFLLQNFNVIKSFLTLECYLSVCFITSCLLNQNTSWFGWYTIQRTAIYRGILWLQKHISPLGSVQGPEVNCYFFIALLNCHTAETCFFTRCSGFSCQDELTSLDASPPYLFVLCYLNPVQLISC